MADDRRPAGSGNPINRLVVTQAPVRAIAAAANVPERRLPWLSGLDGLRAIAVAAVVLYHAGVAALPGGFLGVEVFFVISGYLITGLLLAEWQDGSRRRARVLAAPGSAAAAGAVPPAAGRARGHGRLDAGCGDPDAG